VSVKGAVQIVHEAEALLIQYAESTKQCYELDTSEISRSTEEDEAEANAEGASTPELRRFVWPPKAIHVLGLLQDGFGRRSTELLDRIRVYSGDLVTLATRFGTLGDKKRALEVAGLTPPAILATLLRRSFGSRSQWLIDVAYRQVGRLGEIPDDIAVGIRRSLVRMTLDRRLFKEKHAVFAHLSRLTDARQFISIWRLLLWTRPIDRLLFALLFLALLLSMGHRPRGTLIVLLTGVFLSYVSVQGISSLFFLLKRGAVVRLDWSFWLTVFMCRLIFVLPFAIAYILTVRSLIGSGPTPRLGDQFLLVFGMYSVLWLGAGFAVALRGKYTRTQWWPIFHLAALLILLERVPLLIKDLRRESIKTWILRWRRAFLLVAGAVTIVWLFLKANIPDFVDRHSRAVQGTLVVLLAPVILVGLGKISVDVVRFIRMGRRERWRGLSASELVKTIVSFRTTPFCLAFLRRVRSGQLVDTGLDSEKYIQDFALELEKSTTANQSQKKDPASSGNSARRADDPDLFGIQQIRTDKHALLDEVYRLLETIRDSR